MNESHLPDDDRAERDQAEMAQAMLEQEQMICEALDRCLAAGAEPEDVRLIAGACGIRYRPPKKDDDSSLSLAF